MILIDTNIWSLVLRRKQKQNSPELLALINILETNQARIIGPIRQELLSGIPSKHQFNKVKDHLSGFVDSPLSTEDFVLAARFSNQCRVKGVQGNPIDFIICAVAHNHNFQILTLDKDFIHYQKHLPIRLYSY